MKFAEAMNVLALGAHPNDIELGCAATLNKLLSKGGGGVEAADIMAITFSSGPFVLPDGFKKEAPRLEFVKAVRSLGVQSSECYDFPNHPNLSGPNLNPTSSQFGEITGKSGLVRAMQLSLRFYF